MNQSFTTESICSIEDRLYTKDYLFFKYLGKIYLRFLIAPAILLNTLCLIVLSRPRLSNKSTTILFLRCLAIFDILSIAWKYIRSEINYQSVENERQIAILTPTFCRILYVCMNACISITMWTIVLMTVDKAMAVCYPLKSSIWVTSKRAFYLWSLISLILFLIHISSAKVAKISLAANNQTFCGLSKEKNPLIVDILTASILPITLITTANIVIGVILHRVSRLSFQWPVGTDPLELPSSESSDPNQRRFIPTRRGELTSQLSFESESVRSVQRRTSAQVTRMLLAVTISLILFNIPNTIMFVFINKINRIKEVLHIRPCHLLTNEDIQMYQYAHYLSVIQDILSDLPHIVNFFLYCLAGNKFRSIFTNEVRNLLVQFRFIKRNQGHSTRYRNSINPEWTNNTLGGMRRSASAQKTALKNSNSINVYFNGTTNEIIFYHGNSDRTNKDTERFAKRHVIHIYSTVD